MTEIITLDLHVDTLLISEPLKCGLHVSRMIKHLKEGGELPPVPVGFNGLEYFLHPGVRHNDYQHITHRHVIDGGHHRVLSHYIAEKPLLCLVYNDEYDDFSENVHYSYSKDFSAWGYYMAHMKFPKNFFQLQRRNPEVKDMKICIPDRGDKLILTPDDFKRYKGL